MKNLKWILSGMLTTIMLVTLTVSCDDDDGPDAFTIQALTADGLDLNGATSPNDVPVEPTITATFTTEVDPATVNNTNVKLIRDYDDAEIPLTMSASGNTIIISPDDALATGALYILDLGAGIQSTQGVPFVAASRTFTTDGTFAPAGVVAHYTFENSTDDVIGSFDPTAGDVVDVTYEPSRNTAAGTAAAFNGTTTLIEIPNGDEFMSNNDFTISFWVNANSMKNGQFVLGLAAFKGFQFEIAGDWSWVKLATQYDLGDGTTDAEDSWFPGNGQTKDTNPAGWQGWTFHRDVTASGGVGDTYFKDKWANVVVTYNSATKVNTMYINGEKVKEHDFNLWPDDSKKKNIAGVKYAGNDEPGNKLALGFVQGRENRVVTDSWADYSNPENPHFMGLLDDVRIFSVPVTETEVQLMYNSEKP